MAIRIASYYPRHEKRVIWLCIGMHAIIALALFVLLANSGFDLLVVIIYILFPVVVLQAFMTVIIVRYALAPLDILSRAVAHVSNENNDVTPPNVNGTYYERTGVKTMVETIYNLAVKDNKAEVTPPNLNATILDHLPCGIIALDENRNVLYANASAPVKNNEKGGRLISLFFQGDDTLEHWLAKSEKDSVTAEHSWTRIQTALPDTPGRKICDVVASYQRKGIGSVDTLIVTFDRTAHYSKDEEDMDFIALAAHELRGPITVIRGYLDVLSDELNNQLQPDQHELFKRLSVSASRLSGYVSNILNVSRYDRQHMQLHLSEDKASAIYATIADDLVLRASTLGRSLSVNIPADLPTIAADRNSLTEVMANLVDNAVKYSNEGGVIEISAAVDGNFVTFTVVDHGIGIPSSVLGHLFSKFYRSHRSSHNIAGTGLGLYISKAIIESHGGKIGVNSTEGVGSTFRFSVPIYSTVANKLLTSNNGNEAVIDTSKSWIQNHTMFKG